MIRANREKYPEFSDEFLDLASRMLAMDAEARIDAHGVAAESPSFSPSP